MAMQELQEIEISKPQEPLLKQTQPLVSIRPEVSPEQSRLPEDKLSRIREVLKQDYPSDISLADRIQYKVAELGVHILTSKPFISNYTDGKGSDDENERALIQQLTPKHTGGPSSANSALHSASLLFKVPLEYLRRRWGA